MGHHRSLHEVPPWRRREVARNTGRKCERSDTPPAYKQALRLERKRQERQALHRELREVSDG